MDAFSELLKFLTNVLNNPYMYIGFTLWLILWKTKGFPKFLTKMNNAIKEIAQRMRQKKATDSRKIKPSHPKQPEEKKIIGQVGTTI